MFFQSEKAKLLKEQQEKILFDIAEVREELRRVKEALDEKIQKVADPISEKANKQEVDNKLARIQKDILTIGEDIGRELDEVVRDVGVQELNVSKRFIETESVFDKKISSFISEATQLINKISSDTDNKMAVFHKEISDRYFNAVENMYRFSKEISVIDALAHKVQDSDFAVLKKELLKPIMEAKWKGTEAQKGIETDKNIKTLGQELVQMRKQLHDEMIVRERQRQDIKEITGKIEILNMVIGDKL